MQEAVSHPQIKARTMSVDVERWEGNGTIEQPGFPIKFSRSTCRAAYSGAPLGADTRPCWHARAILKTRSTGCAPVNCLDEMPEALGAVLPLLGEAATPNPLDHRLWDWSKWASTGRQKY